MALCLRALRPYVPIISAPSSAVAQRSPFVYGSSTLPLLRPCSINTASQRLAAAAVPCQPYSVVITRNVPAQAMHRLETELNTMGVGVHHYQQDDAIPREELKRLMGQPDVRGLLCLLTDRVDKEVLDLAPSLKVVSTLSVGFNHIDANELDTRGIKLGYTPGVLTETTADLCVSLLMATARRLPEAGAAVKSGDWRTWSPFWMCGPDVYGSTVGIVGLGRIGRAVADRLKHGFGCKILYTSRQDKNVAGFEYVSMETLLKESDFVSLHCALTPETENLINKDALQTMKRSAILINTARGEMVDQSALEWALKSGEIRAAGLDVCVPEPLPTDHPLLSLNNCVVLPHIGSASTPTRETMAHIAVENLLRGLTGRPLLHSPQSS